MNLNLLAKIASTAELNGTETFGVIISGLAVVFIVLIILIFSVKLLTPLVQFFSSVGKAIGSLFVKEQKSQPKQTSTPKPEVKKTAPPVVEPVAETQTQTGFDDEDEVIAVISAVIAQMSAEDGKQYKIKSVKAKNTKSQGRPVWAVEGLRQNTKPF